ncbi:MAG: chromophore lyase CpcT/CpeT [Gammaproteobacteria bacterium]
MLDELSSSLQGRYDTHHPAHETTVPDQQRLIDSRQRVKMPELGEHVFYLQLNQGADLALYRQRILSLTQGPHPHTVEQRTYTISDPKKLVDARTGDERLSALNRSDLTAMFTSGCEQIWTRTEDGFRGYVDPATCKIISSRTGKPRRIEAETILQGNEMRLVERGYDDNMKPLFGTPQGRSTLLRRLPPAP